MKKRKKTKGAEYKIDLSGISELIANMKDSITGTSYVDVGLLSGASTPEVQKRGAVHELGSVTNNVPQRSFLKMPIERNADKIINKSVEEYTKSSPTKTGEVLNVNKLLSAIGAEAVKAVHESFDTAGYGTWPVLKEDTLKRKKRNRTDGGQSTLIMSQEMENSVGYRATVRGSKRVVKGTSDGGS